MEIKEALSKYKVSLISVIFALPTVIGAFLAVDARYAKAEDMKSVEQKIDSKWSEYRRGQLEDQIFILQMKKGQDGKLSPLDDALLDRYRNQLDTIRKEKSEK